MPDALARWDRGFFKLAEDFLVPKLPSMSAKDVATTLRAYARWRVGNRAVLAHFETRK